MMKLLTAFVLGLISATMFTSCCKDDVDNPTPTITKMIDLHLHLDGALSMESVKQLAKMQNIPIPEDDDSLLSLMRVGEDCHSLNDFLTKFTFPCSLLMTPEGVETATYNLCEELNAQGIIYAEIRFAPQQSCDKGMTQEDAVVAAIAGMRKSTLGKNDRINLILCCMRGEITPTNVDKNKETVRLGKKYLGKGVCAVDLAGAEALYPTANFADIFAYARSLGVPFEIHAGEADGPSSVYAAIEMGASRIGHGVRSIEDPSLVTLLAEKKLPLLVCPTSNCQTEVVSDITKLPINTLLSNGVIFCINTDDPSIEGTDLKTEWQKVISAFNLTKPVVRQLMLNAVTASFAPDSMRTILNEEINNCY